MNLKKICSTIFALTFVVFAEAQVSFGNSEKINDDWSFTLSDPKGAESLSFDASGWQSVNLPHDWSVKGQLSPTLASCTGYLPGGIGWYRKTINISESKQGEKIYLYFEGVYNHSEVYINGHLLGKRPNGYISFVYDATPYVKYGENNVIAVRVDHSKSADSRWYTGSGIYRDVWLVSANPLHIAQWGVYVYPEVATAKQGILSGEVEIENGLDSNAEVSVKSELYDAGGKLVASTAKKQKAQANDKLVIPFQLKIGKPILWSLNNPYLYTLKTIVMKDNVVVDETSTTTGFRSLVFDANKGFALNGKWMKVKGVCLHHDSGVLGSAFFREVWERRLKTLKEVGVNAIRTSHNPQSPILYELCDKLGLLVLDEAADEWEYPKRKWIEGWNVGTPGFQGNYEFFEEWAEKDMADLVRRDRNHISIFAWSIVNEVDYPNDPYSHPILDGGGDGFTQKIFGGYKKDAPNATRLGDIAKRMVATVKKYDKSRPTTAGLAGVAMSNETEYPGALDIAGYNYTESRYELDHKKYPNRVIFGSENRHELAPWKAVKDNEYIFGQFLWTGIDYLGESGQWPSRGFYSGLLDFGGFIKPRGYFRQSLWSDEPMAYLGTYPTPGKGTKSQMKDVWSQLEASNTDNYEEKTPSMDAWPIWNYDEGQSIRVVCYTNAAKAKLLLNGSEVGAVKDYDNDTGIIYWDIPYREGKLEVVGLNASGQEVSRNILQSTGRPYAIKVISVDSEIAKEKGLAQVVLQVVDENNRPVMLSDSEITCHIAGSARLLGLEGSNNEDMSDYTDNVHRAYHGRLLAYIQATGDAGTIHLKFTSPWLKGAEVSILAK